MTAKGLREKAHKLLREFWNVQTSALKQQYVDEKLVIDAMALTLEEAERAVHATGKFGDNGGDEYLEGYDAGRTDVLNRLASLRSELGSGPGGKSVEARGANFQGEGQ